MSGNERNEDFQAVKRAGGVGAAASKQETTCLRDGWTDRYTDRQTNR